jgi:alpha-L-fucosidase
MRSLGYGRTGGPTSAIGDGDWYARNMYIGGSAQYQYHVKTYGHPSKFGYPANFNLYFPPHAPAPQAWAEQGNESEAWKREWFLRAQDLIDQHHPDLYYEDGPIPFDGWGRSLVAHYYNQSLRWHNGKLDVVYTAKRRSESCLQAKLCFFTIRRLLLIRRPRLLPSIS